MRVEFVKEMPKKNVVRDIKKATGADVVTDEKNISVPDMYRNEYGRHETVEER